MPIKERKINFYSKSPWTRLSAFKVNEVYCSNLVVLDWRMIIDESIVVFQARRPEIKKVSDIIIHPRTETVKFWKHIKSVALHITSKLQKLSQKLFTRLHYPRRDRSSNIKCGERDLAELITGRSSSWMLRREDSLEKWKGIKLRE